MSVVDFEGYVRRSVGHKGVPPRWRVMAAALAHAADGMEATRETIANVAGMSPRTVETHLYKLRDLGWLTSTNGVYRPASIHAETAEPHKGNPRGNHVASTRKPRGIHAETADHPRGNHVDTRKPRGIHAETAEPHNPATFSRDPSPLPGEGGARVPAREEPASRQALPEGFGDVQDAWLSLPGHERLQLNAIDARQLAGYVSKHGALLVLEAIGSIAQGSANYDYHPPLHWVNDRATRIADRRAKATESNPTGAQRYATDRHIGEMERLKRDNPEEYARVTARTGRVYGSEPVRPGGWGQR